MNEIENPFSHFTTTCENSGLAEALQQLSDHLIEQSRFHELFEVRKLQLRQRLGMPVGLWQPIDELPSQQGKELEAGLLEICGEVGELLMKQGDVAGGWQYLEPVGDKTHVANLLKDVEVTDENVEALIQIATAEGLAPELGFQLVLDRFGTCSSITTFESMLAGQAIEIRRGPAKLLVCHLYEELANRIRSVIAETESIDAETLNDLSVRQLINNRDWLFEGLGHHIDTTHLASTVRISKILDDPGAIEKAIELTEYGCQLNQDFHYSGQAPFENTYENTREFLLAISDPKSPSADNVTARISQLAESDQSNYLDCAAWLVHVLDRLNRGREAVEAYMDHVHVQQGERAITEDVCPNLMTLLQKHGHHEFAADRLKKSGDLLAYATVISASESR